MVQNSMGEEASETRAIELYQAAAAKGDGYAAFNLGVLARTATVKFATHDECIRLLTQAANSGIVPAGAQLGDELAAVDRDEEALTWLVWAAERGHDGAMNAASDWFRDGIGTPTENVQAMRWLLPLTAKLNTDAVHKAHQLGDLMTDAQIREAGRLSGQPVEAETTVAMLEEIRKAQDGLSAAAVHIGQKSLPAHKPAHAARKPYDVDAASLFGGRRMNGARSACDWPVGTTIVSRKTRSNTSAAS
jgi:hypothetical protein